MNSLIYSEAWREWSDPEIPDYISPTQLMLDRHIDNGLQDKTAIIVDGVRVSYGELLAETCRVANSLIGLGLPRESRVLVSANDSLQTIAIWLGAIRAGLIPVSISDLYKPDMFLYFIEDTGARAVYIDPAQLPKLRALQERLPVTLEKVIVNGATDDAGPIGAVEVLSYPDLVAGHFPQMRSVELHANDMAYMFYSGGTTGTPKGIVHLAHDFILVPERHGFWWYYNQDDVVFATSKKYFTHGLWPGVLIPLYFGATIILSSGPATPAVVTELIETFRPTKLITVPTIIKLLLAYFDEIGLSPDFSSLQAVYTASEKMPPEIFEKWHARFGHELMDSIGSSEVTYEWIANRPSDFRRGSLGRPLVGVEIRLVDDNGKDITQPDTPGECLVKSRTACLFYWRKFDQTKAIFQGEWVHTGDQLQFDSDGYFWFAGRSNDVFKVKGMWVSPIEIEAAITSDHRVQEAAAICVEDGEGFSRVKAFVVLRKDVGGDEKLVAELKARVRADAGGYKVPDTIEFVAELPRTPLQKIDRKTLREMEAGARRQ
ncbi:benzoate-CoA ligase family protein [Aquamicrobium segne]|uniref:Benzoate-CoA ligase family protein n=1 Tax=Aquamicrobium segne TaxID=469547 RepID=A0ABW0GT41_9HYPH